MCWVMPPASPETTLAWRMASSSEVLPWSTWPMMVTTGGRDSRSSSTSGVSNRPSSTSDSATRLTVWPISSAMSWAVSASITSVILCISPCFISRRMTSTRALRHAVGEFLDGDRLGQDDLARRSFPSARAGRPSGAACGGGRRRPSACAPLRSPRVAVVTVRRPRFFISPPRDGVGRGGRGRREAANGADAADA